MRSDGLLSIQEAASFLRVSRPTINARREQYGFKEIKDGKSTLLQKKDLLSLYTKEHFVLPSLNLVVTENDKIDDLFIDSNSLDLRKINLIDAYGAISLIVASIQILEKENFLHLILSDTSAISTLCLMDYFKELQRRFAGRIFWNDDAFPPNPSSKGLKVFFPIKYIAYRGQETKYLSDLGKLLVEQGFDENTGGYLEWIIGELADNALTHAQGPCYILVGQFSKDNSYMEVAIGDTGKGVYGSLKENKKYSHLTDEQAFVKAFESNVSCWPDDKPRGKGLSDLLSLSMGSGSIVRVDSKNKGLLFNFSNGQKELQIKTPMVSLGGARFCWVLINNNFKQSSRLDVDRFIEMELKKL